MAFLKQHRKATLELEGRKLKGNFEVSLTNESERQAITEMVNEIRKQLREFDPSKPKKKAPKKKMTLRDLAAKKKVIAVRKVKKKKVKRKA